MSREQSAQRIFRAHPEELEKHIKDEMDRQLAAISIPFDRFFAYSRQISSFERLCVLAIDSYIDQKEGLPSQLPNGLARLLERSSNPLPSTIEFAKEEKSSNFSFLKSLSLVSLCSSLEALVSDVVYQWLFVNKYRIESDALSRINVPLIQFAAMNDDEKAIYILEELEGLKEVKNKPAFEKLEAMLDLLGLRPAEIKRTKDQIRQMFNLRNVILHKASIVDARLLENCPNLSETYRIGDRIAISSDEYCGYALAVTNYSQALLKQMSDKMEKYVKDSVYERFACAEDVSG